MSGPDPHALTPEGEAFIRRLALNPKLGRADMIQALVDCGLASNDGRAALEAALAVRPPSDADALSDVRAILTPAALAVMAECDFDADPDKVAACERLARWLASQP